MLELGESAEQWGYTEQMVKDWFTVLFGVTPTVSFETSGVSHQC